MCGFFHHPNIVCFVDYSLREQGITHEAWGLVPLFKGGTLCKETERLKHKGNFSTKDQILQLLLGICRGLEVIHAQVQALKDVYTSVMLGDEGAPVLMDLGSMNQACTHMEGSCQALAPTVHHLLLGQTSSPCRALCHP